MVGVIAKRIAHRLPLLIAAALLARSAALAAPRPVHPPGRYVAVSGAKLWVESEGQGGPLVLIAGGPGLAHDYFHPYFSALAATHRVLYYDAFGRGRSDRAAAPREYSLARDVADIEGLRRALELPRIGLLGHSYGSLVALAYALAHPAAVSRLILVNPLLGGEMWQAANERCNQAIRRALPDEWHELQRLRSRGMRSSAPAHRQIYHLPAGYYFYQDAPAFSELPLGLNGDVYYAIAGDDADFTLSGDILRLDLRPRLARLKMPVLVLAGRHDRLALPEYVLRFPSYAPRAQLVVFEKSGHFVFVEETAKALAAIRGFLGG